MSPQFEIRQSGIALFSESRSLSRVWALIVNTLLQRDLHPLALNVSGLFIHINSGVFVGGSSIKPKLAVQISLTCVNLLVKELTERNFDTLLFLLAMLSTVLALLGSS